MQRAKKPRMLRMGWYPISITGKVVALAYALVPPYLLLADTAGALTTAARVPIIGGMSLVLGLMVYAKRRGHRPFAKPPHTGFTLIELLVVISIIGLLSAIIFPSFIAARDKAMFDRTIAEFRSIYTALELYADANQGQYPPDANRNLPPGIQAYLGPGVWPQAPFPNAVYDWDAWAPSDLSFPPFQQVYQISVRFCTAPNVCTIPNEPWAAGFDYYSALYYCIQGPCRAHSSQPVSHPAYCVNC